MKTLSKSNALWRSLLSAAALILLIIIGIGSDGLLGLSDYEQISTYENGKYTRTSQNDLTGDYNKWTGPKDVQGRWDGPVTVEEGTVRPGGSYVPYSVETITYEDGRRNGKSITAYPGSSRPDKMVCYSMGKVIPCQQKAVAAAASEAASQLLYEQYPWYVNTLNVIGFEDDFIKAYVDTLETIILAMEYMEEAFMDYYDAALDSLEGSRFDTMMYAHGSISMLAGQEELLHSRFRLAVLDHSRTEGSTTFGIINEKYPGYLDFMEMAEVSDQDFELFCSDMDSLMNTYGPLDKLDPFYTDSIDARISRALTFIASYEEDTSEVVASLRNARMVYDELAAGNTLKSIRSVHQSGDITPRSSEVALIVFYTFLEHYYQGDKISLVLEETFNQNHSLVSIPTVTTTYLGSGSAESADVSGYIHDDGGGAITSSGIAWSTRYDPTIEDEVVLSGATTGSFSVELQGLTEGETYYARAFATNSAGTAYGNCVEFVAASTVGIEPIPAGRELNVYPNPVSGNATFTFREIALEHPELVIVNLKGQVLVRRELSGATSGIQRIEMDLSGLESGVYQSHLTEGGRVMATRKFLIVH